MNAPQFMVNTVMSSMINRIAIRTGFPNYFLSINYTSLYSPGLGHNK